MMTESSTSMPKGLVPREGVYDLYWQYVCERQSVFEKRYAGSPEPWTDDKILQKHKFTNVFRASDRVSQYMIKQVCYGGAVGADLALQIVAFRTFSKIETWENLKRILGHYPVLTDLADGSFQQALATMSTAKAKLYTGAFILCATKAYGYDEKYMNHIGMLKDMFLDHDLHALIKNAKSLAGVYDILHKFSLMGDFMSYQTAIDLNYSELIDFSENDFVKAGPGALRGLKKCFVSTGDLSPEQVILWLVENQQEEFRRLNLKFNGLFGRPMSAIDVQNCFCEIDKYCREAVPELASNRKKIKALFQQNHTPVQYFFPPKWHINHRINTRQQMR